VVENNSKKHLGGCRGEGARASVKCPIGPSVQSDRLNEYADHNTITLVLPNATPIPLELKEAAVRHLCFQRQLDRTRD
jgi:hypothetical protein